MEEFQRFELQIGSDGIETLKNSHIAIFGLGGVGGFVAETLARSGVGQFTLVDKDTIDLTNLNRQILALHSTIGQSKVEVCKSRIMDINPSAMVSAFKVYYAKNNFELEFSQFDYVVDAVDDVEAKIEIIKQAKLANKPVISCMGTGNKLNPMLFKIDDIYKSNTCPLAKKMRKKLIDLGIDKVKCLYSTERPLRVIDKTISSNSFVPSVAGILIGREVILDLLEK